MKNKIIQGYTEHCFSSSPIFLVLLRLTFDLPPIKILVSETGVGATLVSLGKKGK